jgi:hypothetical protein
MACKCKPAEQDDSGKRYKENSDIPVFDSSVYNPCLNAHIDPSDHESVICRLLKRIESLEDRVTKLEEKIHESESNG